jgi:hypothetical protein
MDAGQVHRRVALLLGEVGVGDHAHHAGGPHHRHMVDVVARHHQQRVEGVAVDVQRHGRQRGDFHQRPLAVQAGGQHPVAQVAVGDQAEQGSVSIQQHRRHALVAHHLRGLPYGGGGRQVTGGRLIMPPPAW